jgi:DNA end-binding protein Ku
LHDREQLGALRVRDGVLVLAKMYFADEIRPLDGILAERRAKVDQRELEMALTLIERFSGEFDPSAYEDRYRARLLEIVEEKRRGGEVGQVERREPEKSPDLLAALQESLERYQRGRAGRNGRARRENGPAKSNSLGDLTVDELSERARELRISGRSKMTKKELVAAIEDAE